jgi:hypothetical protein
MVKMRIMKKLGGKCSVFVGGLMFSLIDAFKWVTYGF